MGLFAERGYEATSVGAIERAAGLAARSGALYQHFKDGKQEVLHAAIERELGAIDELKSVMELLPLADLRSELQLMARWNLDSLDRRAQLSAFFRRDGDRLPDALREQLYERLVGAPYEQVVAWIRARFPAAPAETDLHALAIILVEPMSAYHTIRRAFGRVPGDVDDERFIATWVETVLAIAERW